MEYTSFLESKRLVVPSAGKNVSESALHPALFPFQKSLVRWSLRKGRSALFASTGLGKTFCSLQWSQHIAERVLILAPLAVALQTVDEGARWGIPVTYARNEGEAPASGITITNYERLDGFDAKRYGAVVLDECFAAGTLIDTPSGKAPIETIQVGDAILNASGVDRVSDVHRREVPYAIRISVGLDRIISSPNHPYFTQRGWVSAQDLLPGDYLTQTSEAMRLVRSDFHAEVHRAEASAVLRDILLCEMADAATGDPCQSPQPGSCKEAWREAKAMVGVGGSGGRRGNGTDTQPQSVNPPRGASENIPPIARDRPQTFRAWGKRDWFDSASKDPSGCARRTLGTGVCFIVGKTDSRLSDALQARLGEQRAQNRHRGGWVLPQRATKGEGCEEGFDGPFARVDSLEVLESGHPELERFRDADGKLYFYDLGATRHPSYSIASCLVHNSSILKDFTGKTRTDLIRTFRRTPHRLCCTATPAPNDIAEIANHSEFLGVMSRVEMLAAFFVHDQNGWRLKGHARAPFYRWLASWGMSLTRPSDLGFSDEGYNLPPLSIKPHFVATDYAPPGQLFSIGLKGIGERSAVRRDTIAYRIDRAAELIASEPEQSWIAWVGLNDEGRDLAKRFPGSLLVEGSQSPEEKASALAKFARGEARILVTKCSIAGLGLNLQVCARMVFVGLSDSYESYFQSIRRCWRFGQHQPVTAHIVLTEPEAVIYENVLRKEREAEDMSRELIQHVSEFERQEIASVNVAENDYRPSREMRLPEWMRN